MFFPSAPVLQYLQTPVSAPRLGVSDIVTKVSMALPNALDRLPSPCEFTPSERSPLVSSHHLWSSIFSHVTPLCNTAIPHTTICTFSPPHFVTCYVQPFLMSCLVISQGLFIELNLKPRPSHLSAYLNALEALVTAQINSVSFTT